MIFQKLINSQYEINCKVAGGAVEKAVKDAIDCGYRHIDTAFFYQNEEEVGNAVRQKIEEGVVERSDMFITTKVCINN